MINKILKTKHYTTLILLVLAAMTVAQASPQDIAKKLSDQKLQADQAMDPMVQEIADIEKEEAEAELVRGQREERRRAIEAKIQEAYKNIQAVVGLDAISALLTAGQEKNTIGNCSIEAGRMEGEFYITQDSKKLRLVFAKETTSRAATAQLFKKDGLAYTEILQAEFNPDNLEEKSGPMKALIRYKLSENGETQLVHAQFQGQSIDGWLEYFSSKKTIALTCLNIDQVQTM